MGVQAVCYLPFGQSLANYAVARETTPGIGNADYVQRAMPHEPAWEDKHGVHMSVSNVWLLPTVHSFRRSCGLHHFAEDGSPMGPEDWLRLSPVSQKPTSFSL